ncbi:SH3 domain-containing protein [Bradyrhizobium sp. SSUT18]|uniref:SH3 domain-containing protein n=1 Tax=unclassified Bradyrhizobium TaxID=2631580 RepID=UPI002448E665|nr:MULTISPECIES: SH3 domain-containing protein [unclassified Bradyrhizobium]MDH2348236.1 SH3 domain-containing protein [Bradyrhizobium sp. SSUT77]MDH2355573.1 SH3 domain-containing protein [Bradyrhizobium sp. SSUT112]MDH2404410.1 SH3 domain-containing protein [Bradyrhizobium sp. SSUT18]
MRFKSVLVAALLLAPTAALAAPGMVTVSTGLRAGPGSGFPLVDRIPGGARVNIHGCLRGNAWCDVSFSDDRGWVSSQYLEYLYRNHYVYLPDYVDEIDVPIVPFVLTSYWSSYYEGRPWYRRHAYWNSYWSSHQSVATRMTIDPRAARIGRAATRDAAIALGRNGANAKGNVKENVKGAAAVSGRDAATARHDAAIARRDTAVATDRTRAGRSERIAHERTNVQSRNPRDAQARIMHEPAAHRTAVREQPMGRAREAARAHEAPRVSAAPASRPAMPHVAQPNVSHGSPMNAHAQMPAPRAAAPAMPHGGGGGAPHVNAAPRGGGAPAGGPGGDHQKH